MSRFYYDGTRYSLSYEKFGYWINLIMLEKQGTMNEEEVKYWTDYNVKNKGAADGQDWYLIEIYDEDGPTTHKKLSLIKNDYAPPDENYDERERQTRRYDDGQPRDRQQRRSPRDDRQPWDRDERDRQPRDRYERERTPRRYDDRQPRDRYERERSPRDDRQPWDRHDRERTPRQKRESRFYDNGYN